MPPTAAEIFAARTEIEVSSTETQRKRRIKKNVWIFSAPSVSLRLCGKPPCERAYSQTRASVEIHPDYNPILSITGSRNFAIGQIV